MFSLEIIRSASPAMPPKVVMLDFDGTVSTMREGWHSLLSNYYVSQLKETPAGQNKTEAEILSVAKKALEPNIGKQPVFQFYTLADLIREYGGTPRDPEVCLQEYYKELFAVVHRRHELLRSGLDPKELLVPGTLDLLAMLRQRGIKLYLVSGTEEEYIKEDAELLRITGYFDGGIFGGTKDQDASSKRMIVRKILSENHISGSELVSFGDGQTETREVRAVGGLAIGVASDESARQGVDQWKRSQLIEAGADWIIPDFTDVPRIEKKLFG
ncbi:MAG: haloacid dehalogenase-like hydrolase [Planctomycetaceae bacterium]|jgi:phosphoglycolate phosphatase-like HAD superfamily hydrolase|nr:haloacid dehalogenase-like hydrolase [Planctomycetaceae bacterium]